MTLHIVVCVKSVMSGALPGKNRRASGQMELNPFDVPALRLAIFLAKAHDGTVTVVSMGPPNATFGLHQALSMGADRAILISDPALKESDTYVTATVLGSCLDRLIPFDLVLFGTRTSDSDTGHVAPQTAEKVQLPFVGHVTALTLASISPPPSSGEVTLSPKISFVSPSHSAGEVTLSATVEREMDGYVDGYEILLPAMFSIDSMPSESDVSADLISLYGIDAAFEHREIEILGIDALGLTPEETGLAASPTKIVAWNKKKKGKICQFIEGTPEQQAEALVEKLTASGFVG